MSDTKHLKYHTKHRIQGRANIYGLCPCGACRDGRRKYKISIERIKHKFRNAWKTGREFVKGFYTD